VATETTTQIIREDPQIEAYRVGLLQSVSDFIEGQRQLYEASDKYQFLPPEYRVAGLTDLQEQASLLGQGGIGVYQPYLQRGVDLRQSGAKYLEDYGFGGLSEALGATREGQEMLANVAARANEYRNIPYSYQTESAEALRGASGTGQQALSAGRTDIESALGVGLGATTEGQRMLAQASGRAAEYRNVPYQYQQEALEAARGAGQAQALLKGTGERFSPTQIQPFMSPYEESRAMLRGSGESFSPDQGFMSPYADARAMLGGSGERFSPDQIQGFMSPYEDAVVQQTLADIRREGDIREQGLQAQAAAAGAFGGSRQAVAEQELARNVAQEQARAAGQLRSAGYTQAAQQAQQAFEQAKQREQAGAGLLGQFGSQAAQREQQAFEQAKQREQAGAGLLGQFGSQAAQQAQQAFEQAKQREQAGAGLYGQLGSQAAQTVGQLGTQYGQLEQANVGQMADIAQRYSQLGAQGAQLGLTGAQAGAALGMQQAGMEADVGQALGQLGLQYGQLEQANLGQMGDLAQASGQFGQQLGSLAGMGGTLSQQMSTQGLQEAGIGQLVQSMLRQDVKALEAFGARDQALAQAALDANRMNQMQMYQFPYQQYGFLSDVYKGVPGSQQSITVSGTAEPSPFQQVAGLGIAGLSALGGAKSAGLF